jgi:hypothetical protein
MMWEMILRVRSIGGRIVSRRMAAFGERVVKEARAEVNRGSEVEVEHGDSGSGSGSGSGATALKRLHLHNLYISSKSLTTILQALPPSISPLTLDSVYSDSALFTRLEQGSDKSLLLPKLQVLESSISRENVRIYRISTRSWRVGGCLGSLTFPGWRRRWR